MKKRLIVPLAVLSLSILVGWSAPRAANAGAKLDVSVAHPFMLAEKEYPAGDYELASRRDEGPPVLTIRPRAGGDSTPITVVTRLARETHPSDGARLVFDMVGETRFLSEIWFAGQDGFLVRGTTEDHRHEVVPVKD